MKTAFHNNVDKRKSTFNPFNLLLATFLPPPRDFPPESPTSWTSSLPRSSGSMSGSTSEGVVTVGDTEVKLRKSKKKKKRSSMIFISEERDRTSTLDNKRVRLSLILGGRSREEKGDNYEER